MRAACLLFLALCGCQAYPRAVEGVPFQSPWAALPLRGWLAEGRGEPEAMAVCPPPECRPGMVVGVIRLSGQNAQSALDTLQNPERLKQALEFKDKKPTRSTAAVHRLATDNAQGFALSLRPKDGAKPPAYAAALGQIAGSDLRVVIVVGEDEKAVETKALAAAESSF